MHCNSTTMRLIALISVLAMPLANCAKGPNILDLTLKPRIVVTCPKLDPPPAPAIDALEADAKVHPETGQWAVQLEKHLTKIDACEPTPAGPA